MGVVFHEVTFHLESEKRVFPEESQHLKWARVKVTQRLAMGAPGPSDSGLEPSVDNGYEFISYLK